MISAETSYVKVLIWDYSEINQSTNYGHVALETYTGSPNYLHKYISFWTEEHSGRCVNKLHFHSTTEQDDYEVGEKPTDSYLFTSLNVDKVNEAFEKFKARPEAWGALGWGILGAVYPRNQRGLTLYLLEKGGFFNLLNIDNDQKFNSLLKKIFVGLGYLYSGFNLLLSYKVYNILYLFKKTIPKNRQIIKVLSENLPIAIEFRASLSIYTSTLAEISRSLNLVKDKDIGPYQMALTQQTANASRFLDKLPNSDDMLEHLKLLYKGMEYIPECINLSHNVSRKLFVAAIISAVAISIFNYFSNIFFYSKLSNKEIRTLVENAVCIDNINRFGGAVEL